MSDEFKHQAALAALEEIKDGMVVGLGTGSTASHFIRELGALVHQGLQVLGIPTSEESRKLALAAGIALTTFAEHPMLDVTVDGADEISPALDLIKGLGGALVREKVVAHASKRVIIVADDGKLVDRLGRRAPIPVEVVPFAAKLVTDQIQRWGGEVRVRMSNSGSVFVSDNGNTVLDWMHGVIEQPQILEKQLKLVTGVVDCGIFTHVADCIIVAGLAGIRRLERRADSETKALV